MDCIKDPLEDYLVCIICKEPFGSGPKVTLGEKGSQSINKASKERRDSVQCTAGQLVHLECRKQYCSPNQIAKFIRQTGQQSAQIVCSNPKATVLRSAQGQFDFSTDCFYCGQTVTLGRKRKSSDVAHATVKTVETRETILAVCKERGDDWANVVQARLLHVHDLHAADAVYHKACSANFRTLKQIPANHVPEDCLSKKAKVGRPLEKQRIDAFLEVARYFEENDDEQITVQDLIHRMDEILADTGHRSYSYSYMKQRLQEHFGDKIIETEINGKPSVVTFRNKASEILHEFYSQQDLDPDKSKQRIIETAAKLIKDDIKAVKTSHSVYPGVDEIGIEESMSFLPASLQLLLGNLFSGKNLQTKIASIGQAIMQATRPRVLLAPLQIGLGIQLHHHFASRFLIDTLNRHGFCCSYHEVHHFEQNAAMNYGADIPNFSSQFVQYVADNVDHNTRTLDGNDTFHGMGMIAVITPAVKKCHQVLRVKVTAKDIADVGRVPIYFHNEESLGETMVKYEKLHCFKAEDPTALLDVLWKSSVMFGSPRPAWSGMMQLVHQGKHPGKSSVMFLPMIDMNPSDITCVYSTLKYIENHARRYSVTPIVTFDQPLWWKAMMVITAEPIGSNLRNVVVRLGGFHTVMSFLGCIGHLMSASGLQELCELIYASNAVVHMLTGKAIARAVRGHFIVDAALNAMLIACTLDIPIPSLSDKQEVVEITSNTTGNAVLDELASLYDKLMQDLISVDQVCHDSIINTICDALEEKKVQLRSSRTAALWLQYMDMIDILRKFLRAERTGNWELHLQAISEMLPYLAASGHNNYTKSALLYLQRMSHLNQDHPEVYEHFQNGKHIVRRSDRYWAGLSTDLVIEQVLMRSIKASGGLTRGRGMTEQQRLIWSLSMPACAEVNKAMQELTGVSYNSGEQNKDITVARQARDWKDTHTLLTYLQERNPFTNNPSLQCISTGVHAHSTVNVDTAKSVGITILSSMEGATPSSYTFKKSNQVVTLATKTSVKIDGVIVQIDPQLLFQRLTIAAKISDDVEAIFKFELCSYPPALFDSSLFLREAQKPVLANTIWNSLPPSDTHCQVTGDVQFVLDGGSLLQRIPWTRGATYEEICTMYTDYVSKKYGEAIVVFDGYGESSTKDMAHQRRAKGQTGVAVTFTKDMKLTTQKSTFLVNSSNKQQLINMLGDYLRKNKCQVYHAPSDADVLIVQTAVKSANSMNTVLVGEDTDLLILLCYYTDIDSSSHNIFFRPEPKKGTKNHKVWDIKVVKKQLGREVCNNILFLHAILGCDTTSQLFGIGKGASLKKFRSSRQFQELAKVFHKESATEGEISMAGEQALVLLYNGKTSDSLDSLRYKRFHEKVATNNSHIHPKMLPPTSAAAKYHSLRVYYQVKEWKGSQELNPLNWGWKRSQTGSLIPILTDLPPAPAELLKIIHCKCQSDCSSMRCTCRKHNIDCSPACGNCRGTSCSNTSQFDTDIVDDDILDDFDDPCLI